MGQCVRTLTETLTALGHTDRDIYPFSELFQDYQVELNDMSYKSD